MSAPTITAIVTTFNEEREIADCLDTLSWCDQCLVVDSYSTDRTLEIVRGYPGVEVLQHAYYGGAAQKNWALGHARCDWVLLFDADERCTPELRAEIERRLASGSDANAYTIHRRVFFLGRQLRYSGWRNDRVVRLIRRGTARYENRRVHARMITTGPAPLLRASMDHHMVRDIAEYVTRITRYGIWGAAQHWRDGRRSSPFKIALRPLWRFLRNYFLFRGFLDGTRGLVACALGSYATYVKWTVLWGWQRMARQGQHPALPDFDDDPALWGERESVPPAREPEAVETVSR